jgi:hypothetical protein
MAVAPNGHNLLPKKTVLRLVVAKAPSGTYALYLHEVTARGRILHLWEICYKQDNWQ